MQREELLSKIRTRKTMSTDFLGGTIILREITASDRLRAFAGIDAANKTDPADALRIGCRLLGSCAVDGTDQPILSDAEWESLADYELGAVMDLAAKAMELNAMTQTSVEEIAKN